MLLQRERPCTPRAQALSPPHTGRADRTLSALAGALVLASWAVGYVGLVPPDRATDHAGVRVAAFHARVAR